MDHAEHLSRSSSSNDASQTSNGSNDHRGDAGPMRGSIDAATETAQAAWNSITTDANVPRNERIVTGVAGALLGAWGIHHGGVSGLIGAAAGAVLLARSVTGHCPMYAQYGTGDEERELAQRQGWTTAATVTATVTIAKPRDVLYRHWRDLTNFGDLMSHVERVEVIDERRSHWVVNAPMGQTIEFDSTLTEDIEGRRIAWEAEESAAVRNCGWVEFRDAPGDRGTEVRLFIAYEPPGGELGRIAARFLREEPGHQARDDLQKFKQLMETGQVSTSQNRPGSNHSNSNGNNSGNSGSGSGSGSAGSSHSGS